jgi:hypothetical protein
MVIQQRHEAAMTIIHQIDPKDRPLILAYVVAGSDRIRELEGGKMNAFRPYPDGWTWDEE